MTTELMHSRKDIIEKLLEEFGKVFLESEANAAEFVAACLTGAQNVMLGVIIDKAPPGKEGMNRLACERAVLQLYEAIKPKEIVH